MTDRDKLLRILENQSPRKICKSTQTTLNILYKYFCDISVEYLGQNYEQILATSSGKTSIKQINQKISQGFV